MHKCLAVLSLAALAAACADQATAPRSGKTISADITHPAPGAPVPATLTIHEPGYRAQVVAEGLPTPQGTVELGNGVLFVAASEARQILRILPSGAQDTLAAFDAVPGAFRASLVDLIPDGAGGLLASQLVSPVTWPSPIWRVGMSGAATLVAGVPLAVTFLARDGSGQLYATQANGGVVRIERDGGITGVIATASLATRMRGLTFDDEGRLYVLAAMFASLPAPGWSEIRRFDLTGAALPLPLSAGELITAALPLPLPQGRPLEDLVIWPRGGGDLFTVDGDNVYRVRLDGTVSVFASGLQATGAPNVFNHLALSGAGDLLVTEYAAGRVTRIGR